MNHFQGVGDRVRHVQLGVLDQPRQDDRNGHVQDCGDDQSADNPCRHILLRVLDFRGRRRNGVKAEVGEEDDGRPVEDPLHVVGQEGVVVGWLDEEETDHHENHDNCNLNGNRDVVNPHRGLHSLG